MGTPALADREPRREHIHISLEGPAGHLVCYGPPALLRQLLALIATRPLDAWPSQAEDAHVDPSSDVDGGAGAA